MSGSTFPVGGRFPFEFGSPIDDDDVNDLKGLLGLDELAMRSVKSTLKGLPPFLTREQLKESLERGTNDSTTAALVFRVIRWVERFQRPDGTIDRAFQLLRKFQVGNKGSSTSSDFSEEDLGALQGRILELLACAPGRLRQSKAESLAEATGQRLKRIRLICDFRPIFDGERQVIEGVMPLTTLSMVCEGVNGLPVGFEAILSEKDVENLCEMATMAKQKLAAMRHLAAATKLPIPSVDLTELPTKITDEN